MKQERYKNFKDIFRYLSATVVTNAIAFFSIPIYTRFLSPSDYGVIALFTMFGTVSVGFISFGLQGATYRYYFKYQKRLNIFKVVNTNNFTFNILICGIAGFVLWNITDRVAFRVFDNKITPELLKLSYIYGCLEYFLNYLTLILVAQTRAKAYSSIKIAQIIINTGISLYLLYICSFTYMARIYAFIATTAILTLVSLFLTKNTFTFKFSLKLFKRSVKFAYPQIPLQIIGILYTSFDKTMLSNYKGLVSVGHYNIGERFSHLIKLVMDSIVRVWTPFFMKKAHENTAESKQAIVKAYFEFSFILLFFGLVVIYFSEELIQLMTTEDFYAAAYVVPFYVFYYLFGIIRMLAVNQIGYSEKTLNLLPSSIVGILINIGLNIVLIKRYGPVGAALATSISAFGASIIIFYLGEKVFPVHIKKKHLTALFLLTIAFASTIYPIMLFDINIVLKILIKVMLLALFVFVGLKTKYISLQYTRNLLTAMYGKVKH